MYEANTADASSSEAYLSFSAEEARVLLTATGPRFDDEAVLRCAWEEVVARRARREQRAEGIVSI